MNPNDKQALDRVQFQQNELTQRMDALVADMNKFREEAMALLHSMAAAPQESK